MKKNVLFLLNCTLTLATFCFNQVSMAHSEPMLKMITIKANAPGQVNKLARMGIDISEVVKGPVVKGPQGGPIQTYRVEAVVSSLDIKKLKLEKFSWSDVPGKGPVKKIGEEYDVYKSFDAPKNGISGCAIIPNSKTRQSFR